MISIVKRREFNKVYLLLFLLITATFLYAYGRYIWGGDYFIFTDAGSDCADEYYPTYVYIVNQIREGELTLWNHSVGLGYDTLTRQERLMDPFGILIMLVGVIIGEQAIAPMLVVAQYLKILISGFLAFKLLGYFDLTDMTRVMGGYLYAFNSFLIIWGQHYWFGAASIYILLLMIVVEEWLKNIQESRKWMLVYSIVVGANFLYSVYIAYMAVIATSVYALIRYLYLTKIGGRELRKEILKTGGSLIFATLLGVLIASAMVLPFIDNNIAVSSRVSTESIWVRIIENLIVPYDLEYVLGILTRMISSNALGINALGGSYYGHPLLCISIVGVPLLAEGMLEIYSRMKGLKEKLTFWGALFLILFVVFVPLGSMILNAFQYAFGRYSFILIPVFIIVLCFGLDKIYTKHKMNYFVTATVVTGVEALLVYSAFTYENNDLIRNYVKIIILLNIFMFFAILFCVKGSKKYGMILILTILIIGCTMETYLSSASKERETKANLEIEERSSTEKIIEVLHGRDPYFFRFDKTYNDFRWLGDSLIEGLNLPTGYNSTLNKYVSEFYEKVWPQVCTNHSTRVTTTREFITDSNLLETDNVMTLLGVKYLISKGEIAGIKENYRQLIGDFDDRIVYENINAHSLITAFKKVISEAEFEQHTQEEKNEIIKSYLVLSEAEIIRNGVIVSDVDKKELENEVFDNHYLVEKINDTLFKTNINTEEDKFFLFTIPYREGWRIYLNGSEVQIIKGDYGFLACHIPAGEYEIEIKYENYIYLIGCLYSAFAVGIWGYLWYNKNIKKR